VVRERLLCQKLPPPPPGLDTSLRDVEPGVSPRDRFTQHAEDAACSGCHRLVDPIGFAFEHYDGVGRYRPNYQGATIDATGHIVSTPATNKEFDGLDQLVEVLATSPDVHQCYALQQLRYGYGLHGDDDEACMTKALYRDFSAGGLTFESITLSMIRQPHFTQRVPEGTSPDQWYAPNTPPPIDPPDMSSPDMPTPVDMASPPPDMSAPPAPQEGISVREQINDDWGQGWCQEVFVENSGAQQVTWAVTLQINGTLTTHWNSVASAQSGQITFTGAPYNATIGPAEQASFGFCATR
jgi:hypothetical protein